MAIIGFRYRKFTHYTLYSNFPPIYGSAIIRSVSFLFLAPFHEKGKIFAAIKSGSTVQCNSQNQNKNETDLVVTLLMVKMANLPRSGTRCILSFLLDYLAMYSDS